MLTGVTLVNSYPGIVEQPSLVEEHTDVVYWLLEYLQHKYEEAKQLLHCDTENDVVSENPSITGHPLSCKAHKAVEYDSLSCEYKQQLY